MTPEKKNDLFDLPEEELGQNNVLESLEKTTKEAMLEYGSYVIEDRAIPSVLDGLKPVQRRSLYAMKVEDGLIGSKTKKLIKPVGTVMSNFHPHGDASIISTYVNMCQPFKNNFMVLNPQGNYGTIEDPAAHAAARYIEISMKRNYADLFFQDMDKEDVVSWQDNFDGTTLEPKVLPTKLPYHLINGTSGIAYSMSTKVPSFNSKEMINLFISLINDGFFRNDYTLTEDLKEKYKNIIPAPDFATGCNIYFDDLEQKDNVLFGLSFQFRMRVSYELDEKNNIIKITNIPYEVSTDNVVEEIRKLREPFIEVNKKKIPKSQDEILNCSAPVVIPNDITGLGNTDATIELHVKSGSDLYVELAKILKHTNLDKSFSSNNNVINEHGVPVKMSVFDNLKTFLYFRRHVVLKSMEHDLKKIETRLPLLEAFFKLIDQKELFTKLVTQSEDEEEAFEKVQNEFGFSKEQTDFSLSLQMKKLTKKERMLREEEHTNLNEEKKVKTEIISTSENIFNYIKEDYTNMLESSIIKDRDRNSKILTDVMSLSKESLIKDKPIIISLMENDTIGWVDNEVKVRNRGTQSSSTVKSKSTNVVRRVLNCNLKDELLFVTNTARVFKAPAYEINKKFYHISDILNLAENEKIIDIKNINLDDNQEEVVFVTNKGLSSRTSVKLFKNSTRNRAIIVNRLSEGDSINYFDIVKPNDEMVIVSGNGYGLRFSIDDIRKTTAAAKGVRVYDVEKYGEIKNITISREETKEEKTELIIAFENGGLKKLNLEQLKLQKRNRRGNTVYRKTVEEGEVIGITLISERDNILLNTKNGKSAIIKVNDINSVSRTATGIRKGLNVDSDDIVINLASIKNEDELEVENENEELIELSEAKENTEENTVI